MTAPFAIQWTAEQRQAVVIGCRKGLSYKRIGRDIGRSPSAVSNQAIRLGIIKRKARRDPPVRFVAVPASHTVVISHADVCAYYELGWRFVGFEGAACRFEWRGEVPRWPA